MSDSRIITKGNKVRTTHEYSRILSTQDAFIGVVTKDNGDTVEVATKKRCREIISKEWLEIVQDDAANVCPSCGTCLACGTKS